MPQWVGILEAAKEWGVPPWVVVDGPALWYMRWSAYRSEQGRAERHNKKHAPKRR